MIRHEYQCQTCKIIFLIFSDVFRRLKLTDKKAKGYCPKCHPIRARRAQVHETVISHLTPDLQAKYREKYDV